MTHWLRVITQKNSAALATFPLFHNMSSKFLIGISISNCNIGKNYFTNVHTSVKPSSNMRTIKTTLLRVKYSQALKIWLCEVIRRRIFTMFNLGRYLPVGGGGGYVVIYPKSCFVAYSNKHRNLECTHAYNISVDTW